ncbi:MAG: hypothetical protein ACRD0N_15240 [Acidimicrobiales bacterium]
MSGRRGVRVRPSFFERLDELLPDERTADGQPSATDLLLHELPSIIDLLATAYEETTLEIEQVPGVRVLVTAGRLVTRVAIYVALGADDAVEVIYMDVE